MLALLLSVTPEQDRDRICALYDQYHKDVLRFAAYKLQSIGDPHYSQNSEDVAQLAWLKIVKYLDNINPSRGSDAVRSYLFTITANEAIRFLKAERKEQSFVTDVIADEDFYARLQIELRYREVVDAIKLLDERYRAVMLLHYCEERSVKEVAKLLGIAEKTVYTRLARGKEKVLQMLGEEGKKDGAK